MEQIESNTVGRFEIKRLLCHEGRVPVYQAIDPTLHRDVAIKLVDLSGLDANALKDYDTRVEQMESLRHTNLCPVLEIGQTGKLNYVAMSWIKGHPLGELVSRKVIMQPKQVALLVGKLGLAMHHMHRAGLLHGYLSPDSVVIDSAGEPVIVDLGLARALPAVGEEDAKAPYQGFQAPEVEISGGADTHIASDIYSIGAIGFTMLCGRTPASAEEVRSALLPSALGDSLGTRFKEAFASALAIEPSKRFKTAMDLANVMDALFRDTPQEISAEPSGNGKVSNSDDSLDEYTQFDVQLINGSHIVHLHDASALSSESIAQSKNELFDLLDAESPERLLINFASVQFCSSATVGILIELNNAMKTRGTKLYLCGMRDSIREVFRVLNLDGTVFEIRSTVANALKSAE